MSESAENKGQILVVEDSTLSFKFIHQSFQPMGFHLVHAKSGQEALDILDANLQANDLPDLIIMDLVMDDMDGLETCSRVKEIESLREIPVIFRFLPDFGHRVFLVDRFGKS